VVILFVVLVQSFQKPNLPRGYADSTGILSLTEDGLPALFYDPDEV